LGEGFHFFAHFEVSDSSSKEKVADDNQDEEEEDGDGGGGGGDEVVEAVEDDGGEEALGDEFASFVWVVEFDEAEVVANYS